MKKILVSAYACEPNSGSEPGVGWIWTINLAKFNEVWVVTRKNNKDRIKKYLEKSNEKHLKNIKWLYYDLPKWMIFWKKGKRGIRVYYFLWQLYIFFKIKKINKQIKFDIIHHVTFVNYWLPTFLVFLGIPFIWGPVGGADSIPRRILKKFDKKDYIKEVIRNVVIYLSERSILTKKIARKSICAIATTPKTYEKLKELGAQNVKLISQVILPDDKFTRLFNIKIDEKKDDIRFVSIGQLHKFKGFDLGIKAFSKFINKNKTLKTEYWIVGNGPEEVALKKLVKDLGLLNHVFFKGWVKHDEIDLIFEKNDVLIHPSFRESGGWVIVEAMAAGMLPISLDLAGPSFLINKNFGFKIKAISEEYIIEELALLMEKIYFNKAMLVELRKNAKNNALKKHTERYLVHILKEIYNEL